MTHLMRYGIIVSIVLLITFFSCKKDDDGVETVPPRDLSEVALENDNAIKAFMETHFYNYEEFQNPPAGFDYKIKVDTIAGENSDKTPISESPLLKSATATVSASQFGISDGEEDITHTYYYLVARTGAGENPPTVADSVYVRYEGYTLDRTLFDSAINSGRWFDLQGTVSTTGAIAGFKLGLTHFNPGNGVIDNPDGTFEVEGFGSGIIIMPAGLAYFNSAKVGESYAPIAFNVNLLVVNTADHDRDGIPSILEDRNGNKNLFDDDTDDDDVPDYLDGDDDGDGVSTRSEITDENGEIIIPYPDADNDGVPDYLDPDTN